MFPRTVVIALICMAFSHPSSGCECVGAARPCEYLRSETVFVGTVAETVAVRHPMDEDSWSAGYAMRFNVENSLRGGLGNEVTIQTGNGGGDCGTPLDPGERLLIFAYRGKDGQLWTGMCSGNLQLPGDSSRDEIVEQLRSLIGKGVGNIFGRVVSVKPAWRDREVDEKGPPTPMPNIVLHVTSSGFSSSTRTAQDGSYEFDGLPPGKYTVVPDLPGKLDFDHDDSDSRYQADLVSGECTDISFKLEPTTSIIGHVKLPSGVHPKTVEVEAIPINWRKVHDFEGVWDLADDDDNEFKLWPLPPGDYYVGVNINSSPSAESPFPPTYYPGVTNQRDATIIHIAAGEVRKIELPLRDVARPRPVHFIAIGLDGKPMKTIYIQLEDLRHPGDAESYLNVDLDSNGAGTLNIYAGYSYHLHGSHWVSYGNDWCSKPVSIPAGSDPVTVKFVMDHKDANCQIDEIDKLRK
jgi:hypothetical protein